MMRTVTFLLLFALLAGCACQPPKHVPDPIDYSINKLPRLKVNGKQIKIAIIDTGLDLNDKRFKGHICEYGHRDFTGFGLKDNNGHGTHVAGIIQKYAGNGDYCFLIYKFYSETNPGSKNLANEIEAIREAAINKASFVNISAGGPEFSQDEFVAIKAHQEVNFVLAAGNEHTDMDMPMADIYYPAFYKSSNITIVGGLAKNGHRLPSSNYSKKIKNWELGEDVQSTLPNGKYGTMSGTSQATAVHTGKLVRKILTTNDRGN